MGMPADIYDTAECSGGEKLTEHAYLWPLQSPSMQICPVNLAQVLVWSWYMVTVAIRLRIDIVSAGFDHINRNAPVLIRTPKLTRFEPA